MPVQALLGEKEGAAGGVREDCVNKRREGEKQQTRKHSGIQNGTTHFWKSSRGWKQGTVSQGGIMMVLGHSTRP